MTLPLKRNDYSLTDRAADACIVQSQSTAEQDMQIIRNKRQSSTGGAAPGQQKNKYRKRSVSVCLPFGADLGSGLTG